MFYPVFVNAALAILGVDPQTIRPELRQVSQVLGKQQGYSPQETALLIAAQLPDAWKAQLDAGAVRKWIRLRKVNPIDLNVSAALVDLGWADLNPTSTSADAPTGPKMGPDATPSSPQQDFIDLLHSAGSGLYKIASSWTEPSDLRQTLAIQAEVRSLILAISEAGLAYPIEPEGLAMRIATGTPIGEDWNKAVDALMKNIRKCRSERDAAAVVAFSLAPAHVRDCRAAGRNAVELVRS